MTGASAGDYFSLESGLAVHSGGEVDVPFEDGMVGAGTVEGGRYVGPVEPVEAHGQVADCCAHQDDIAGPVKAVEGGVEQRHAGSTSPCTASCRAVTGAIAAPKNGSRCCWA
jgi:hypothetical protein